MEKKMDRLDIPEVLDDVTEEDLNAFSESLAEAASGLAESAAASEDDTAELERLSGEYQRIQGHLAERQVAADERAARTEAAMGAFAKAPADDEAAEAAPDDEAAEGEKPFPPKKAAAAAEAPVELAAEETVPVAEAPAAPVAELAVEEPAEAASEAPAEFAAPHVPTDTESKSDTSPEQSGKDSAPRGPVPTVKVNAEKMLTDTEAPVELASTETETVELAAEDSSTVTPSTEAASELATETSSTETLAAESASTTTPADEADHKEMSVDETAPAAVPTTEVLNAAVEAAPSAPATVPATAAPAAFATSRPFSAMQSNGADIDTKELAKRIAEARHRMGNLPQGVFEYVTLASGEHTYDADRSVSQSEEANFAVFRDIQNEAQALVASGGTCAPLSPSYDIFRLAEPQSPVENALPSVGATRGGIRFIVPPAFTQATGGVRVTTNAQDIAGYTTQTPAGTTAPKPCVSVVCPGVNDVFVDAVSQCVQFGNLNYRVFPEQVESFMEDLAVVFAQTKEVKYLDAIDAASTSVNLTPDYGATRALTFALSQLTWAYRKRNHMSTSATLDVYLPDSVLPLLKADMVNDWALGLNFLDASIDDVKRMVFTKLNINAVFYYDSATGDLPNMQQAQAAGTAVPFLASIRAYIFAPGTFVRLDGGTLDVGIVRDSALNGTNNLQIFAEEWIQVAKVGLESIRANITLCPSGTGPAAKTALICAS